MFFVALLVGIPILAGLATIFVKPQKLLTALVRGSAGVIIVLSIIFAMTYWSASADGLSLGALSSSWTHYLIAFVEIAMALFIILSGVKAKKFLVAIFAILQIVTILGFEFGPGHALEVEATYMVDRLALFMVLIIGVIGSLICVFAVKYMEDYHHHHHEIADNRGLFFSVLFIFLGAMMGLVLANKMSLMLFFWEITSLASFLLIGYSKTAEAINNAFLALTINVFGGLLFTIGIVVAGTQLQIADFQSLINIGNRESAVAVTAVFLIACAGLTKAAQMPFSKWLLGAMVAPTPVSAILHSSTMVKAGVYVLIRLAPMLGLNAAGVSITLVGAVTFLVAAVLAISQMDAKRILAYSTISNLGLIVACAGINTAESIWAAMMLIVFHAIAKSLLFLTVGATEHCIGNRNVESMDGLYKTSPALAMLLIVGIAGMFIAPFGMLISKWAAMEAFVNYGNSFINMLIALIIAFGSTVTFFFWTKWLGKLIADTTVNKPAEVTYKMGIDEKVSLYSQAGLVVLVCALFPIVSKQFVIPYIISAELPAMAPLSQLDTVLVLSIMLLLFILSIIAIPLYRSYTGKRNSVYMAGENIGDNMSYHGSMGQTVHVTLKNWYLESIFGEKIWFFPAQIVAIGLMVIGLLAAIGGVSL